MDTHFFHRYAVAMSKMIAILAGLNGLLAVAAGAFGAHGLKSRLSQEALTIFETAARYHMYHALALAALAALAGYGNSRALSASAYCMQGGIILFSGSLYAMSLSRMEWKWLGPITPFGGLLFMIGWGLLAVAAFTRSPSN